MANGKLIGFDRAVIAQVCLFDCSSSSILDLRTRVERDGGEDRSPSSNSSLGWSLNRCPQALPVHMPCNARHSDRQPELLYLRRQQLEVDDERQH